MEPTQLIIIIIIGHFYMAVRRLILCNRHENCIFHEMLCTNINTEQYPMEGNGYSSWNVYNMIMKMAASSK